MVHEEMKTDIRTGLPCMQFEFKCHAIWILCLFVVEHALIGGSTVDGTWSNFHLVLPWDGSTPGSPFISPYQRVNDEGSPSRWTGACRQPDGGSGLQHRARRHHQAATGAHSVNYPRRPWQRCGLAAVAKGRFIARDWGSGSVAASVDKDEAEASRVSNRDVYMCWIRSQLTKITKGKEKNDVTRIFYVFEKKKKQVLIEAARKHRWHLKRYRKKAKGPFG